MLLSERWRGYGHRSWPRGRCFLAGVAPRIACLVVVVAAGALALPAGATAEPVCTDTWTGPNEGTWQTAANWSTGKVPTSTDVACIAAEKTVRVTEGANTTGVLLDKGTLVISGGSLEVANALEASSVNILTMQSSSTLTGAGTLDITGSFETAKFSRMSGSGSTVVKPGASASITPLGGGPSYLLERTLVNEGTLTFAESDLRAGKGAVIRNTGTFIANSQEPEGMLQIASEAEGGGSPAPSFVNTGTFEKTAGSERTTVAIPFENQKVVNAQKGALRFTDGGSGTATGEWRASEGSSVVFGGGSFSLTKGSWVGEVEISEPAKVTANGVASESADVSVASLYTLKAR